MRAPRYGAGTLHVGIHGIQLNLPRMSLSTPPSPSLIVLDDDPEIGRIVTDLSARLGYDASFTSSHLEVLEALASRPPHVLILDLQMPGVDGIALMRLLSERKCEAHLYFISGHGPKVLQLAQAVAQERGLCVAGAWPKPFDIAAVTRSLQQHLPASETTKQDLRQALMNGNIEPWYQPICRLAGESTFAVEALVRWQHPTRGLLLPGDFVPVAERAGMSVEILRHVASRALADLSRCTEHPRLKLTLNLSPCDLGNLDLPDELEALCAASGVTADRVILELTESVPLEASADRLDILARLRVKGFGLAIDDFGTGFSSLLRLRDLPFTEIKIDRHFVARIASEPDSAAIVRSIVYLTRSLGLTCIAEGVENAVTLALLRDWGCECVQGHHIAKPAAFGATKQWLQRQRQHSLAATTS